MEIAKNGSIRDLPPSKRFKFINSDPDSTTCPPLPAKKRVFAPPPAAAVAPAAVPLCLPVKKRAVPAPPSEDAIPVCLPAKKRAYAPPVDGVTPACLPAKKRPYALPPPPTVSVTWPCVPTKKRVHAPPPRQISAGSAPVCLQTKSRVDGRPPRKDAAGTIPVCVPAKNRVHGPAPRMDAACTVPVPVCPPAKKRVHVPSSRKDAAGPVPVPVCPPAKKHVHAPSPRGRGDGVGLVPVCLPTNKRVMPPLPSPSVQSDGGRHGSVKDVKPQGSIKHCAAAINPKLANGAEGGARGKEVKKSEKPIDPKELKELVPVKPRSPKKAKDLEKKDCKVPDVRPSKVKVCKKDVELIDAKQAARKEEPRSSADDEAAREQEQEAEEEQDDGVLCAVCRSTDGDPSDPIVFCDGCDLMVHASCYGNPLAQAIPDGDWFCSLCSTNKSKAMEAAARPRCCLCPAKGGAMKRTTEGQWAHIACALLVPEVFFRDPDGRDGVDCSRVPAHRFTKDCYICGTNTGCALECSQPKCGRGFHVSCGLDGGLCIEYQEGKSGAIVAGFCREHTELWEKVKFRPTSTHCK